MSRKLKLLNLSKNAYRIKNNIYRNCSTVVQEVQPYENIPGPPGNGLPFIGHMNLYVKKPAGIGKSWENLKDIIDTYLSKDDKLFKLYMPGFNTDNGKFVLLLDPKDVEHIHRNEGKYPNR